jgi:hypothetical protein
MVIPGAIKTSSVEIRPVFSFKVRTIVGVIVTVAIVTIPGGVVIINIPGEFIFVNDGVTLIGVCGRGGRCISVIVGRRLLIDNRGRSNVSRSGRNIYPCAGDTEADMCVNVNLGITLRRDEAGGYDGGKNE